MHVLITGGAGFVGSCLAKRFCSQGWRVTAFDNLRRRGSELNLPELKSRGISFFHGDIRCRNDLFDLNQNFDLFIEASAEPSVLAGLNGTPDYLLDTNLKGTLHCLEFARSHAPRMIFLSTSRVYSIAPLRELNLDENETRFELSEVQSIAGASSNGVSEAFPLDSARSLYGATKLCSEIILQEYVDTYNIAGVVDRCGVIAGPGQFGKVDQGVFTMWVANHIYQKPLKYIGFGGTGKQVRDLLHPDDLYDVLLRQNETLEKHAGRAFNLGGGRQVSVSLKELTDLCQEVVETQVRVDSVADTTAVDIPLYLSDCRVAFKKYQFQPKKTVKDIVIEIRDWILANKESLRAIFT